MTAHDIIAKLRANADQAEMRRSEFRPPVVRPWGVAPGVRPRRIRAQPEALAISWLALLLLAIGFCAAVFWR